MAKHHYKLVSKSPYLASWDLNSENPKIVLTIDKVVQKMTEGLKENSKKNICYFKENVKPMIINTTNGKVISVLAGSKYVEDWSGLKIEITTKKVKAFGDEHDALRVSPKKIDVKKVKITKGHPKFEEIKNKYDSGTSIDVIRKYYDIDENILK